MSGLATTRASPDLAAKAERRRQKFALKEWEGSATRAAHDARVRSAKSQYADIFQSNGNTPGARRGASPAGAPATPAGGSYAATEMARRARRHRRATKLVVVDEAHHVAGDARLRQRLSLPRPATQRNPFLQPPCPQYRRFRLAAWTVQKHRVRRDVRLYHPVCHARRRLRTCRGRWCETQAKETAR